MGATWSHITTQMGHIIYSARRYLSLQLTVLRSMILNKTQILANLIKMTLFLGCYGLIALIDAVTVIPLLLYCCINLIDHAMLHFIK